LIYKLILYFIYSKFKNPLSELAGQNIGFKIKSAVKISITKVEIKIRGLIS